MKVLILGSKGMLGQELVKSFGDHAVTAWDKADLDITDQQKVKSKIGSVEPDLIVNAAAYTDVDGCEENEDLAMKVNGQAVGYLAEVASAVGAEIVHYSTDYVFSGDKKKGYKEDEKYDPEGDALNVYGASKALGEKLLQEGTERFYLIRTSWLFGPGGGNFVEAMLNLASGNDALTVIDDQHGKPTYAPDLAEATRKLVGEDNDYGIYHRTNEVPDESITWYDFANEVFDQYKKINSNFEKPDVEPVTSEEFPRSAKRPQWSILLNTKLPELRDYRKALEEYLKQVQA